jgi:hypothetical protein
MIEARRQWFRVLRCTLVVGSVLLSTSCNSKVERPELFPVQGQLFLEKRPAHKASLFFHPVGESGPATPRPHATVDESGNFEVGTYQANDGAPPGRYKVTVIWRNPPKAGDEDGETLIPLRYMDPAKSGLPMVEIQARPNTLPPIRLTKN